jgi:hypothetical protein
MQIQGDHSDPADSAQAGGAPKPDKAHHVFISHSSKDKAAADAICEALERGGVTCWIAPRDIAPGATWATSILHAISASKMMVLLFSGSAQASQHIRREVERAVHHGVPIAPIRLDSVKPADDLEYFLSSSHWMEMQTPQGEPLRQLVRTVRAVVGLDPVDPASPRVPALQPTWQPPEQPAIPGPFVAVTSPPLDPATIARVELELKRVAGPLAKQFVNAMAPRARTLEELCQLLLPSIAAESDQDAFLKACIASASATDSAAKPAARGPATSPCAWDPQMIEQITRDLAAYIGPMATVVVTSAARQAGTSEELFDRLAAEIPSPKEQQLFRNAAKNKYMSP